MRAHIVGVAFLVFGALSAAAIGLRAEDSELVVVGTVVSKEGVAVAGVDVRVWRDGRLVTTATTDEAGAFAIGLADDAPVDLKVFSRVSEPRPLIWYGVVEGVEAGRSNVELRVAATPADRSLTVRILGSRCAVPEVVVRLDPWTLGVPPTARTDDNGSVTFAGLVARPYVVSVGVRHAAPHAPARMTPVLPRGQVLTIRLERLREIEGRVIDREGKPCAAVGVLPDWRPDSIAGPVGDITGINGRFRVQVPVSWSTATIRAGLASPGEGATGGVAAEVALGATEAVGPVEIRWAEDPVPPEAPVDPREREIRAIYETVLRKAYVQKGVAGLVLLDPLDEGLAELHQPQAAIRVRAHQKVHPSAWASFREACAEASPASRELDPGVPVCLLPRSWWLSFQRDHDDDLWQTFYDKFPAYLGVIDLTPIGFSEDGTQAILHVGHFFGYLAASGTAYALEKRNGQWEIVHESLLWVS